MFLHLPGTTKALKGANAWGFKGRTFGGSKGERLGDQRANDGDSKRKAKLSSESIPSLNWWSATQLGAVDAQGPVLRSPNSCESIRRLARIAWFSRIVSGLLNSIEPPLLRIALRGANNCESRVWGDLRESLTRYESPGHLRSEGRRRMSGASRRFPRHFWNCDFPRETKEKTTRIWAPRRPCPRHPRPPDKIRWQDKITKKVGHLNSLERWFAIRLILFTQISIAGSLFPQFGAGRSSSFSNPAKHDTCLHTGQPNALEKRGKLLHLQLELLHLQLELLCLRSIEVLLGHTFPTASKEAQL